MVFRNGLAVFLFAAVLWGAIGCGKKKESEDAQPEAAATEYEKPSIPTGEMVFVPAGEFTIGTNDKKSLGYPERKATLPAFWIDKYEVTNYEFRDFSINSNYAGEGAALGQDWRQFATSDKALFPVVYITWKDAETYCKSKGKRLPTEEEWEKAARGPNGFAYPWGNEWQDGQSNTSEAGLRVASAIGEFGGDVSPYGAHDMLGNVQEWTASWYKSYPGNPKQDPNSGETFRVVRGLSRAYKGKLARLYDRTAFPPKSLFDFGCRCAKDATPEDIAKFAQDAKK